MTNWKQLARTTLMSTVISSLGTTAASAWCGQRENKNALAPLNAVSHILWGEEAASQERFSAKYTLAGVALNASAMLGWALVFAYLFDKLRGDERAAAKSKSRKVAAGLLGGVATSALAYVVDYHVVPKRLTPGLEDRLPLRSLLLVYIVLALSLGAGGVLSRESE